MARIPTAANVAQAPSLRDPGVSVPAVGQEVARGVAAVGTGLTQIAEKQQLAEDRRFLADFDSEARTRAAEAVLQFEGQQESSTYAAQVEQAVQQIGPSIFKEFESRGYTPSQDARTRAEVGFTGLLTNTRVSAITDQHNAKVAAALRGIQNNADVQLNLLVDRPSRENLAAVRESLQETFDQAEGMANPDVLARMRDKYQGEAFKSYVGGLIGQGQLGAARRELASDEANDLLDPNDKLRLKNELEREGRAFVARAEQSVRASFGALEDVVGYTTPSTEMVEGAQAQVNALPPSLRAPYQARLDAIVAEGERSLALTHAPPEQQQQILSTLESRINAGGATPADIERFKLYQDIITRSEKQRQRDATGQTVGAGYGDAPTAPPNMNDPAYREQAGALANATAARFGAGVQVLHRPMYDQLQAAFTTGTVQDAQSAVAFLGEDLDPRAREAVLGSIGATITPALRLAIDNAGDRPEIAAQLVAASKQDVKVSMPSNNDLILEVEGDVGGAFADSPSLFTDTLAAAKTLTAFQVGAGTADTNDLVTAVKDNFNLLVEGRVVDINGAQVLLPPDLRSTVQRPTEALVEDRLPALETPEQQQRVLVPTVNGRPISMPEGTTFGGLFFAGRPEAVPWSDFSRAPLGSQIAPGVYVPQVDGSTPGAVVGRYTFERDGTPVTMDFPVALSLPAVLGLTQASLQAERGPLPENIRALREAVERAMPGSRERFEAQRRLREAEAAR